MELQGRVLGTTGMVFTGATQIGYLFSGILADKVFIQTVAPGGFIARHFGGFIGTTPKDGIGLMLGLAGLLCLITTIGGYYYRPVRTLDVDIPDAYERETSLQIPGQINIKSASCRPIVDPG